MKILDKILLNRLINMIMSFIISILKIISPKDDTKPDRKIWFPKIRRKK